MISTSAFGAVQERQSGQFSARLTIAASYRFFVTNLKAILSALWMQSMLAVVVLMAMVKAYFTMLAIYLNSPEVHMASLTASAAIAGFFVWLFLNVVASARLARVVGGQTMPHSFDFPAMAVEARLFAGVLRYLLVLVLFVAVVTAGVMSVADLVPGQLAGYAPLLDWIVIAGFGVVFSVRCGLLGPALAVFERQRILRRGFELSRGHFWQLAVMWLALLALPGVVLQSLGELLIQPIVGSSADAGLTTLATAAERLASNDLAILAIALTLTLSSSLCLILTTIGSCLAYRALSEPS